MSIEKCTACMQIKEIGENLKPIPPANFVQPIKFRGIMTYFNNLVNNIKDLKSKCTCIKETPDE